MKVLKRVGVGVCLAIATLVVAAGMAVAAPEDPAGVVVPDDTLASVRLSAVVVTAIVGTFIPLLVGLLTKWSSRIKGILMVLLNAVNALVTGATLSDGTAVISQQTFVLWLLGVVQAVAMYLTVWKPLNLTSARTQLADGTVRIGKLENVGVH